MGPVYPPVLRIQSIAVDEDIQYSCPSLEEIRNLPFPENTLANISLTSLFLAETAAGENIHRMAVCY